MFLSLSLPPSLPPSLPLTQSVTLSHSLSLLCADTIAEIALTVSLSGNPISMQLANSLSYSWIWRLVSDKV